MVCAASEMDEMTKNVRHFLFSYTWRALYITVYAAYYFPLYTDSGTWYITVYRVVYFISQLHLVNNLVVCTETNCVYELLCVLVCKNVVQIYGQKSGE